MPEKTRMLDGLLNQGDRSSEEAFRMAMESMKDFDIEAAKKAMLARGSSFERLYELGAEPCQLSGSPDVIEQYTACYLARKGSEK